MAEKKSKRSVLTLLYRVPGASYAPQLQKLHAQLQSVVAGVSVSLEHCFYVSSEDPLSEEDMAKLSWLVSETFEPEKFGTKGSFLKPSEQDGERLVEVGPRMSFESAFSTNASSICRSSGLPGILRVERSRRYLFRKAGGISDAEFSALSAALHDRMTEMVYPAPLSSFDAHAAPEEVATVPVMTEGRSALARVNEEKGLGFDDWDLDYYTELFKTKLGRNPTDVECFDLAQSNSEHSRHWFFGGRIIVDGEEKEGTLFKMVKSTLPKAGAAPEAHAANRHGVANSVIAFHDNSSSLEGPREAIATLGPARAGAASPLERRSIHVHPILTAETHNFPCGVAPFPGAETGTGGRLRDVMATGRGAFTQAGVSSYCVGNLNVPGYDLPWEDKGFAYAANLAKPLAIEIEASNGASDYGNKYGEPVVHGFTRSFGQRLPSGERREWVKPIMFSAGIAMLDARHAQKEDPAVGMTVVKCGGPAYRIGMGGGAASSRAAPDGDDATAALDFDAVQRGDAEMGNRLNRLIRACAELGAENPIVSIHDQGAGGNGNVLKEITEPLGAAYDVRGILVGDDTMSVMEIWGAEYQENCAFLIRPESRAVVEAISRRERCPVAFLGAVSGDGRVVLTDSAAPPKEAEDDRRATPVDLPLELVLGKMPPKTFRDASDTTAPRALSLPADATAEAALDRVLRLLSVGSKRFLVHKVDRSVTGLCAQQQCVGRMQLPLADCAVVAHSMLATTGTVCACGEQPVKGLLDAGAQARLTVAEAVTNMMFAAVESLGHAKCSANWMWAAKLPGEAARMWVACEALRDALVEVGVGVDGGKDSLSMAAKCGDEVVKAPGQITVTAYNTCTDVRLTVTPDLKAAPGGAPTKLLRVGLPGARGALGGSALAQVYGQLGSDCTDCSVADLAVLREVFGASQALLRAGKLLAAHDVSDGGALVAALEMAFASNAALRLDFPAAPNAPEEGSVLGAPDVPCLRALFSEEPAVLVEVAAEDAEEVLAAYRAAGADARALGECEGREDGRAAEVAVAFRGAEVLRSTVAALRDAWEATSFALEGLQTNPQCAAAERDALAARKGHAWALSYAPAPTSGALMALSEKPKVAVLRHEGTNGDREMGAAFCAAGFEAWDITMNDLLNGDAALDGRFRGVAFCGGFSFADVMDSGKGWAGSIKFNASLLAMFEAFRAREDTFSLGVCNGCQLMALLGWVPGAEPMGGGQQPRFIENESGRFESRFSTLKVLESNSVLLKGMAGSALGVWVAHGEGRVHFPDEAVEKAVLEGRQAPLRYCDEDGEPTTNYPDNPNGSPHGIAALCSPDGRHLALMPHPERCFLKWQWPYTPPQWKDHEAGAWLKLFQNAREFCEA